jgi:hypothetical protein
MKPNDEYEQQHCQGLKPSIRHATEFENPGLIY